MNEQLTDIAQNLSGLTAQEHVLTADKTNPMSTSWGLSDSAEQTPNESTDLAGEWKCVCQALEQEMGDKLAMRWLKRIVPAKIIDRQVYLYVPSPCIYELVKRNYANEILTLWQRENPNISGLSFQLNPQNDVSATALCAPKVETKPEISIPTTSAHHTGKIKTHTTDKVEMQINVDGEDIPCFLDKSHTFDSFVIGSSNEFAAAAARRVAEDNTIAFNPLYIHASVGLGKTHLMHAIAWKIKEMYPEQNVLYLSSEQFFQHFIKAIRNEKTESFRKLFRTVDVLMIDDVQFIFGKKATQVEFFHTFNQLIARGKKIILSADSNPMDLHGIEDRLKTRIAQGLVVQIQPTTYELRLGILQQKLAQSRVVIPDNVIDFLAKNITTSVRELEGALKRLIAHAELIGTPVNMDTARIVLKDILQIYERHFSVYEIQLATAAYYGLRLADLKSTRRERKIARPRQLAMYLAKQMTALSLPDIGGQFDRDHTTVIHAIRTIEGLLERDSQLTTDMENIVTRIKEGMA